MSLPYHRGPLSNNSNSMNQRSGSSPWGGNNSYNSNSNSNSRADETSRTLMELENNRKWAELGEQVEGLKSLTLDINNEVKSQNNMLDGMGKTFQSANEMFGSTINKLGSMISNPSSKHMYYLVGFVVFVFLVIYFLMGRKK